LSFCLILLWIIIFFITGNGGYVAAGVVGCITALFGFYHFRLLAALREQVEKLSKMNQKFKKENIKIVQEVTKLQEAATQLKVMEDVLQQSTEKQKENLHHLTQLNQNLSSIGTNNNDTMHKVQNMSKTMVSKWKEQLLSHERRLLSKVFDQLEFKDNNEGIQEDEFNQFLELLPVRYQARFRKLGDFKQLAGDDGKIDYEEFKKLLDNMADQEALNVNF